MMKKALITGITGQDGSYLVELLLSKGYEVHGLVRRASGFNTHRIDHLLKDSNMHGGRFFLHHGDLLDAGNTHRLIPKIQPDEVYHLAAQSHVRVSFDLPEYTGEVTGLATLRLLEAIRSSGSAARFYQASSSEMFGKALELPLKETTPFYPRSPYGVAKVYAFWITKNYRESYGMHASNGILFNHESPRRGETFVTRKITRGFARIKLGKESTLTLGNLDAQRDWGHAKEYVEGMWRMLQQETPDDYILATNETHTVREFAEKAGAELGFNIEWKGEGLNEHGVDTNTGKTIITIDERYFRPAEVDVLLGDYSKAKNVLGWEPKITFEALAREMARADYDSESHK